MESTGLRIGIVGTSMIAHRFADAARKSGLCRPVAVFSRAESTGLAFAKEEGGLRVETDFERFLSLPELDAVYIASPNALHYRQAMAALSSGKHVLLEKPIASRLAEYRALAIEASRRHLVLMEAMRPLHDPSFEILRSKIEKLGKLRRIDLEYCQYSSRYDRFLQGELPNAFDPSLSNAALMDIGVYPIALLVSLFGLPEQVRSDSLFLENGFEGAGELLCRYPGFLASVSYSKITDSVAPSVITGEEGSLSVDRINAPQKILLSLRGKPDEVLAYVPSENNMVYEVIDFCRAVRQEISADPFAVYSERTMEMLDLVRRQSGIVFPADSEAL
jgi:predicted dehydrogenase